jgi:hypothetical protein
MLAHAGSVDETWSVVMVFAGLWTGWAGWSRLKGRGFPSLPRPGAYALVGLAAILVVGAVFLPRAILGPTPPSAVRPTTSAILSIVQPTEGATVEGDELTVVLHLTGGRIIEGDSTTNVPDAGHLHVMIDGAMLSMGYGLEQTIPIGDLPEGTHEVQAEFVAADHGPFEPRVTATSTFVKATP